MTRKDAMRIARAISSVKALPGADRDTVIAIAQAINGEFGGEKAFLGFETSATALFTNVSYRRKLSEPRPNKALELVRRLVDTRALNQADRIDALEIVNVANIEVADLAKLSPSGGN